MTALALFCEVIVTAAVIDCWGDCREPALAAYEAEEVLQRGSLAFVGNLATAVANGVFGVAKAAAWGREAGFRAGSPPHTPTSCMLLSL